MESSWLLSVAAKDNSGGRGSNKVDELTSMTGRQAGKKAEKRFLFV